MEFSVLWELKATAAYVKRNGYIRVTMQFPDDMLHDSPVVADALQTELTAAGSDAKVYVLADTSYNPLSVDEVAAAHVNADCVIHYGYASLNPVSRTPALCVLPKAELDVQQCSSWAAEQLTSTGEQLLGSSSSSSSSTQAGSGTGGHVQAQGQQQYAVVCCDQGYLHLLPQLQEAMLMAYQGPLQLVFAASAPLELQPHSSTSATGGTAQAGCGSNACCQASVQQQSEQRQQQQADGQVNACEADADLCGQQSCCQQQQQASSAASPPAAAADGAQSTAAKSSSSSSGNVPPVGGLVWQLPATLTSSSSSSSSSQQALMVWLGPFTSPALTHLQLTYSTSPWLLLDPASCTADSGLLPDLQRLLKRRYYLVERARAASMVGLLVGTLGAAGYLQALSRVRQLAAEAGKKTYTLLMGKPNPAKLANFPEIEVFVMLADPQGLILDSKEYLSPIITPHEAYLAFTGKPFDAAAYRLDFGDLLAADSEQQVGTAAGGTAADGAAACVGGNVGEDSDSEGAGEEGEGGVAPGWGAAAGALVVAGSSQQGKVLAGAGSRSGQQVQVHSAAQYLQQHRTYKGLETPATGGEMLAAEKAVPGRSGRAAVYVDEPTAS